MTVYGYLRVSTNRQNLDNNKGEILRFANDKGFGNVIWIQETISGCKDWRKRELGRFFEVFKKDDILIMTEDSRIGRNMLQSMEFLSECKRKGVIVYSTIGDIPNNMDAMGSLITALNGWKSQVERETIAYRTKIKLQDLKDKGIILGRQRRMILDGKDHCDTIKNYNEIDELIKSGMKKSAIAKKYNTSTTTLRKFINESKKTIN